MAFIEVDKEDFQEVLDKEFAKNNIVILKFTSEFCDACMALGFELEELDDNNNNISIIEIDCAQSEDLAYAYGINQVPTMLIYENKDSKLWHKEGVMLAQDMQEIIAQV
ncbi:MAG: thiol-disulfide isomerase/thioredoxin [Sulfurimonas sp.]|jgi:thiol-disulfide isomerase/thioredoxin|uniref:thioredoxin domain-containing protein n=1 Tax=Sulfurimonas sp. TaxID=2022749 RepID=UPI0039E6F70E